MTIKVDNEIYCNIQKIELIKGQKKDDGKYALPYLAFIYDNGRYDYYNDVRRECTQESNMLFNEMCLKYIAHKIENGMSSCYNLNQLKTESASMINKLYDDMLNLSNVRHHEEIMVGCVQG